MTVRLNARWTPRYLDRSNHLALELCSGSVLVTKVSVARDLRGFVGVGRAAMWDLHCGAWGAYQNRRRSPSEDRIYVRHFRDPWAFRHPESDERLIIKEQVIFDVML